MLTAVDQKNQVGNECDRTDGQKILQVFVVCSVKNLAGCCKHFFETGFGRKNSKSIRTESEQFVGKWKLTEKFQRFSPDKAPISSPLVIEYQVAAKASVTCTMSKQVGIDQDKAYSQKTKCNKSSPDSDKSFFRMIARVSFFG